MNQSNNTWRVVIGAIAALVVLGVVGVVAKKKMSAQPSGDAADTSAQVSTAHEGQTQGREGKGTVTPEESGQNVAMLTPAEREEQAPQGLQPSHGKQPSRSQRPSHGEQTSQVQQPSHVSQGQLTPSQQQGQEGKLTPFPVKPGQPLVLLQPGMPGHPANAPGGPMPGFGPVAGEKAYDKSALPAPGQPTEVAAAKPEPAKDSCYLVTYHHKHPGMRPGDETCTHHKNLIHIHSAEGLKLNPKTVCIRVNDVPVKFTQVKGKTNEFLFGVVASVDTAVTARFCTGKFHCSEDCTVPKDDFVEAIGGSDLDSDDSKKLEVAVWDKEDPNDKEANAKLAGDMNKGLKDLDEVAKAATEGYTVFQDWTAENPTFACQNHEHLSDLLEGSKDSEGASKTVHRRVASKQ